MKLNHVSALSNLRTRELVGPFRYLETDFDLTRLPKRWRVYKGVSAYQVAIL